MNKYDIRAKTTEILKNAEITQYPLDFDQLISKNNWSLRIHTCDLSRLASGRSTDDPVYGFIFKKDKDKVVYIGLNQKDSLVRQRFTLAHELGHYVLHMDYGKNSYQEIYTRSNESSTQEVEANYFAAELLMPKDRFIKYHDDCLKAFEKAEKEVEKDLNIHHKINIDVDSLRREHLINLLAKVFAVSKSAATIRMETLIDSGK